jgi:hypothetical protein
VFSFQTRLAGVRHIFLPLKRDSPRHVIILPGVSAFLRLGRLAQGCQDENRTC